MKVEAKIKKIEKTLIERNFFTKEEANKAIDKTIRFFKLEKYTPSEFINILLSTYNVDGVER